MDQIYGGSADKEVIYSPGIMMAEVAKELGFDWASQWNAGDTVEN